MTAETTITIDTSLAELPYATTVTLVRSTDAEGLNPLWHADLQTYAPNQLFAHCSKTPSGAIALVCKAWKETTGA